MGNQGRDPREVMAACLSDPRMQEACRKHDLQTVIRLLHSRGVSLRRIGSLTDLGSGRVSEYMSGKREASGFEVFERFSDGLRIPGHMFRLAPRPWEQTISANPVSDSQPDSAMETKQALWVPSRTVEIIGDFTRRDLVLDRREANRAIAVLVVGTPLIESVERWLSSELDVPTSRPKGHISPEEVSQIEHAAEVFRDWDDKFGGGLRRKAVVGQLNEVSEILRDSHEPAITRRLFRVMSRLAETAAMMTWDSGQQAKAQRYYILALRAAKEAGEYAFGANILASLARQTLYLGHPDDALELIRLAQDGSKGHTTPTIRSMLHTREAWAYAKMGRVQAFYRATGRAEEELANSASGKDPEWIRYFDEAELSGVTGGRLLDLAEEEPEYRKCGAEAETRIERALELRRPDSLRSYALDQVGLAHVHFIHRELEQAVSAGHRAIDVASQTHSDRVRVQIQGLYKKSLLHAREPDVRDLHDRIVTYLAS